MTAKEIKTYQNAASLGILPDEENPLFIFTQANKTLLLDIINDAPDVKELARMELHNRGLDEKRRFVGWKRAHELIW